MFLKRLTVMFAEMECIVFLYGSEAVKTIRSPFGLLIAIL